MRTVETSSDGSPNRYFGRETKFQKVRLELEMLANKLGPGQKLPSIRELSVTMGASISTLSGALEELEKASVISRQQGKGIFVLPPRLRSVWLLCDSKFFASGHSPFWDVLVEQARVRALVHNERLSLHFTLPFEDSEEDSESALHHALAREIEEGRVHGIIGVGLNRKIAHWIMDQGVAYTSFAGWAPYSIRLHDEEIVRQGVKTLVAQGCRRLGLWQNARPVYDKNGVEIAEWRDLTDDFQIALREHGLEMDESLAKTNAEQALLLSHSLAVESSQQQGYRSVMEVFKRDRSEWPDGIIVIEDMMTQGVLAAMSSLGIRPGVDVQIVTHANKGTTTFLGDPQGLIRIEYDPAEVVQRLFDILTALMNREIPAGVQPYCLDTQVLLIEPHLVLPDENQF